MSLEPRAYGPSETVPFDAAHVPDRSAHRRTLLVHPRFFDVRYRINPYMGGRVDRDTATKQWDALRETYERYGEVCVLDPDAIALSLDDRNTDDCGRADGGGMSVSEGTDGTAIPASPASLPDLVFCANHGVAAAEGKRVVLASMATPERRDEPAYLAAWCHEQGYTTRSLPEGVAFEGTGDAIWHPGKRLLWGGYGVRTDRRAYDGLSKILDVPVLELELTNRYYYHLDVCFAPLDAETVLIQPDAFTAAGRARIASVFERVIEAPPAESIDGLACNCHAIDGGTVVVGAGNPRTVKRLETAGYAVHEVATDEFLKAGGSVRCLTLTLT